VNGVGARAREPARKSKRWVQGAREIERRRGARARMKSNVGQGGRESAREIKRRARGARERVKKQTVGGGGARAKEIKRRAEKARERERNRTPGKGGARYRTASGRKREKKQSVGGGGKKRTASGARECKRKRTSGRGGARNRTASGRESARETRTATGRESAKETERRAEGGARTREKHELWRGVTGGASAQKKTNVGRKGRKSAKKQEPRQSARARERESARATERRVAATRCTLHTLWFEGNRMRKKSANIVSCNPNCLLQSVTNLTPTIIGMACPQCPLLRTHRGSLHRITRTCRP
jgi:hypothetical protein